MPPNRNLPAGAALTVELLSAYLANNTVPARDVPGLVRSIRKALVEKECPAPKEIAAATFTRALCVQESLSSSAHIFSMINGKPYRTLRRHLAAHGLTPESYRTRYNLPADYPVVAPDYAAYRRAVAQKSGLGRKDFTGKAASEEAAAAEAYSANGLVADKELTPSAIPRADAHASRAAARASKLGSSTIGTATKGAGMSPVGAAKRKTTSRLVGPSAVRTQERVQQSANLKQSEASDAHKQDFMVGLTAVSSSGGDLDERSRPATLPKAPFAQYKHLAPAP